MARRRMIDPHFWESAQDNNWTADDCTVMMAAISAADDEGRGRLKSIKDKIDFIISEKKFAKSLSNLMDSIKIYSKIYYFLPNWENYQKVSHPTPSKFPVPKLADNNKLVENSSGIIHESFESDSTTVKVSVSKYSLKEVSVGEEEQEPLTFENSSSLTAYYPSDFNNESQLRAIVTLMINDFCKIMVPKKEEITRFYNIITQTKGCTRQTAHKIMLACCQEYINLEPKKQNLPYLSTQIEGKISDAIILAREKRAAELKKNAAKEVADFMNSPPDNDVFSDIQSFAQGFKEQHKIK